VGARHARPDVFALIGYRIAPAGLSKALTSEQRKQLEKLGEHLISAITTSRELSDGCAFRVDPAKASLIDVAQLPDQLPRSRR